MTTHSPLGASGAEHEHVWVRHPSEPIMACRCGTVATLGGFRLKTRADRDGYYLTDCGPRGSRRTLKVHRVVLGCFVGEDPREVDHIDRDRGNNAASNLRYASVSENRRNVGVRKVSASQVRNVRFRKDRNKWQAYRHLDGRMRSLGHFDTLLEARKEAEKYYGSP
jgi:HNH endonuclease/AP2 domain